MARKMHCAPQTKGNDSQKVSEAGKESISTTYQQQNKSPSLEVTKGCQGSSVSRINSDSRCAIITFLSFEPDGNWRIVALPVQCFNHVSLASGINMDGLQLLFPPPVNRLKIDQCKGPRGPLPPCAYSVKSCPRRSFTGSNVHRRCQKKVANKASKLIELPGNSCSRSSLVSSPSLLPHSSAAVSSSDKFACNAKEDKSLKKNSRKRTRKKVRQSKKQSSDSGSTEREVHTKEYVSVSLTSETCSSNDVDKEVGLMYTTAPEFSSCDDGIIKIDCERNEMNDNISVTEAPKSCDSCIDETVMSKATAPIVRNSSGECATFESKNQLQGRNPHLTVIDRETKDIQHVELCCFNDIRDSLVLDSVSIGSKSDESTSGGDIVKQSDKASCGITSNSGDGYFLGQNLMNSIRNKCEDNEGMRNGGQNCTGNDKRVKQKRTMSKSSSFNKFGGVGVLHGRPGKENSHSVWQKVQKNSSDECGGDLKKVNTPTLSQFVSTVEKDLSAIKNCKSVSANVVSKPEDKKQLKNKVGRKSKGKMDSVSGKGHCNYSRKGSHLNRTVLNDNVKVSSQQNDSSNISSQEINQQGLSSVSGFNTDTNCLMAEFQTDGVKQETSEIVHSAQFHPEESDIQKSACHFIANTKNENVDIQESSLVMPDYNAQNHSSGSTLWKWIPIGKKDTRFAKSESNSLSTECSDEPSSKNFNLENSLESKIASFSQNQDSSPTASTTCNDEIYDKASCSDVEENHKLGDEITCTPIEHWNKVEVANHMIYDCENQDMLENDSYRIAQAVNDAYRAQLACEAVHMATGGPVAEFERLLHFCSPVICQSPNSLGCLTCAQDHSGAVSLCRHEMPALSLGCLWQWYEKHGSYGLEIRAQEYENPKRAGGVGHFPFRAYFVPSLSAVQLFKNRESRCVNNSENFPNCRTSEAFEMSDNSEDSSMAPINDATHPSIDATCYGDLELLFEYFEYEQPQQRRPLYERIQELVRGEVPIQSKTYGDPTKLDSINLRELHPRSWYSVAWYPIYRIPDGNFRAAFLTYHSLGHLVRRSANSDSPTVDSCVVSPAVGLQSYNAQGECWFQMSPSALTAEMLGINPSILLKERLRTLEETASLMARAVVNKGDLICTNRHPDYQFFVSRRRY